MTILAASGDDGAKDGTSAATIDFHSCGQPYVVGCGGTKLSLNGTSISSEQAWNELCKNEGATGGGVSEVFALSSYQQNANVPAAPNGFIGRGVPDVAGDADRQAGYSVFCRRQSNCDWGHECGCSTVGDDSLPELIKGWVRTSVT